MTEGATDSWQAWLADHAFGEAWDGVMDEVQAFAQEAKAGERPDTRHVKNAIRHLTNIVEDRFDELPILPPGK